MTSGYYRIYTARTCSIRKEKWPTSKGRGAAAVELHSKKDIRLHEPGKERKKEDDDDSRVEGIALRLVHIRRHHVAHSYIYLRSTR